MNNNFIVASPSDVSLSLLATLTVQADFLADFNCYPAGVTKLNGTLYVGCVNLDRIVAYSGDMSSAQANVITVPGLQHPSDMAASNTDNCLYIVDQNSCVWRVKLTSNYSVDLFVGYLAAMTISVAFDGRVLVTGLYNQLLTVYSRSGVLIQTINLSTFNGLKHVVEDSSSGNLLLSHFSPFVRVCEVKETTGGVWSVLFSYGTTTSGDGSGDLIYPVHVAQDSGSSGLVFAADNGSSGGNGRLVVFDRQLNLLTAMAVVWPTRVSYDSEAGIVFVSGYRVVHAFRANS